MLLKQNKNLIDDENSIMKFIRRQLAANIEILNKACNTFFGKKKMFPELMGMSESTIKKIKELEGSAGNRWDYEKTAREMDMDPRVFSGEYLIKIRSKMMNYNYGDGSDEKLWNTIYECWDNENPEIRLDAKRLKRGILKEVKQQVEDEHYQDLQLWLFWDYMRKYEKK